MKHENDSSVPSRGVDWKLLGVVGLALGLRLIRLGTFPYWHDEVHNLVASETLYQLIFHGNLVSNHPPLPYVLVAIWRALGMDASEWTMRLLPVLAGTGGVWAMYALGKRLFDERCGLFASLLLALSPLQLHHSQDLKEYIYLPCVAIVMVLWFCKAMESGRMRDWLMYGALAGVACYTEIFVGPLLLAINLWAIFCLGSSGRAWRGWLAGNVLGAALFLPWLGMMYRKAVATMIDATTWWVPPPSPTGVAYYFKGIAYGYTAVKPWFIVATVVYALLIAGGFLLAYRQNRRYAILLATWAIAPVAVVYVMSLITQSVFLIRAMLPYAMACYLLAGICLSQMRPKLLQVTSIVIVCALSADGLFHEYRRDYPALDFPNRPGTHPPRDYSGAADYILTNWRDGDVVFHSSGATWLPFFWYGFREKPQFFTGIGSEFIHNITIGNPKNTKDPLLQNLWPHEPQTFVESLKPKRIWFVFCEWERKYLPGNATHMYRWLDSHFTEVEHKSFMGIDLYRFETEWEKSTPHTTERDRDDGVGAEMQYDGSFNYAKIFPDNGLLPRPVEERRGDLMLRFDDAQNVEPKHLATGTAIRRVGWAIENRGNHDSRCLVQFVPSDALVDAASLYEREPASDVWEVNQQFNPTPPPPSFEIAMATIHTRNLDSAVLDGTVTLMAGTYDTSVYLFGDFNDAANARSHVRWLVGDVDVLAPYSNRPSGPGKWTWIAGAPVTIQQAIVSAPIHLQADAVAPPAESYGDVGYLAFRRKRDEGTADNTGQWPGAVVIPAKSTVRWAADIDSDLIRVDIWAYEFGIDGRAYRIFERFVR